MALIVCAPLAGRAESRERLTAAEELLSEQDYEGAERAFREILVGADLEVDEIVEAYASLAECAAALRNPAAARASFVRILRLRPGYALPELSSPLLREPFGEAAAVVGSEPEPLLRYDPPEHVRAGAPFVVSPEVGNDEELAAAVTLHLRRPDGGYDLIRERDGRLEIPSVAFAGAASVEFYLAARDPDGRVTALAGSPREPISIPLVAAAREGSPWYRRWWVWTVVGVAVAGVAVGLSLGLALPAGQSDPCERALGQPCDATVTFGLR